MSKSSDKPSALLVETPGLNREILTALLQQAGVEITTSDTLSDAEQCLANGHYKFIFIDGVEADSLSQRLAGIEQYSEQESSVLIGLLAQQYNVQDYQGSFDEVLTMPCSFQYLENLVHKWLEHDDQDDSLEVLSVDSLEQLKADVGEVFPTLVQTAIKDCQRFQAELSLAMNEQDWPTAAAVAHAVKGSYTAFGAFNLRDAAIAFEQAFKNDKAGEFNNKIVALLKQLSLCEEALAAL